MASGKALSFLSGRRIVIYILKEKMQEKQTESILWPPAYNTYTLLVYISFKNEEYNLPFLIQIANTVERKYKLLSGGKFKHFHCMESTSAWPNAVISIILMQSKNKCTLAMMLHYVCLACYIVTCSFVATRYLCYRIMARSCISFYHNYGKHHVQGHCIAINPKTKCFS